MAAHNELGRWGEDLAAVFLREQGMVVIDRDWHSGHRDIDIVAIERDTVVFVEVKTRRNSVFGDPVEAIDNAKLRNLRIAIDHYVKSKRINQAFRLDVITIVGSPDCGEPTITHLRDVLFY